MRIVASIRNVLSSRRSTFGSGSAPIFGRSPGQRFQQIRARHDALNTAESSTIAAE
jgi:hypothetical protein